MRVHEYQAKDLFSEYGVPVAAGRVAETPEQAVHAAEKMGLPVVLKAQIHAGGRGKGGGIQTAKALKEVRQIAGELLGRTLVTPQTGPEGRLIQKVLVEKRMEVTHEFYAAITLDRRCKRPRLMVSPKGGVDIEKVAAKTPRLIASELINPFLGLRGYQARRLAAFLALNGHTAKKFCQVFSALWDLFAEKDVSLVEINPLVVTKGGEVYALDAKINFDDNGLFRHPEIEELRDPGEENPLDVEAAKHSLNYIKLTGNVGCMVNGAGLAMATMDLIKLHGGEPANFLDVGGGANETQIEHALRILLSDPATEGIFINIFGGILRCDVLAKGLAAAAAKAGVDVPVVIRLEGTNVEEGRKILSRSPLSLTVASTMDEGAQKILKLVQQQSSSRQAAGANA
jgi:succinyl-CoA synthetase beta subunit